MKRALVAPDKFRGTALASEISFAMADVLDRAGYQVGLFPMSDGGEGLLEVFGGSNRSAVVTSADGRRIIAPYRLDGQTAVIEMAEAAGLTLAGGAANNDPLYATTKGVGELIKAAIFAGAKKVIVGCGGSASTDGGLGAIEELEPVVRLKGIELVVAADVEIRFSEAAREFAAQKGATPAQVALLTQRLEALENHYFQRFGVDISSLEGAGAAGGLAGGLAAIGGHIVPGFEVAAEFNGLYEALEGASLIVTGEGFLDSHSFLGKVVGRVVSLALEHGVQYLVVVGDCDPQVKENRRDRSIIFSLVEIVGEEQAYRATLESVRITLESALKLHGLGSL
ncbi:MAG: hypothetical protein HKL84_08965 [Acidimicrobiaceae bacterium]|nr:hypothetical protein [Acidimicrobiaceae bacterium]